MLFGISRWQRGGRYGSSLGHRRGDKPVGYDAEPALKVIGVSTGVVLSLVCAAVLDSRSSSEQSAVSTPRASLASERATRGDDISDEWERQNHAEPLMHQRFAPSLQRDFTVRALRADIAPRSEADFVELGFAGTAEGRYIVSRSCAGVRLMYEVTGVERVLVDERPLSCASTQNERIEVLPDAHGVTVRAPGAELRYTGPDLRRGIVSRASSLGFGERVAVEVERDMTTGEG